MTSADLYAPSDLHCEHLLKLSIQTLVQVAGSWGKYKLTTFLLWLIGSKNQTSTLQKQNSLHHLSARAMNFEDNQSVPCQMNNKHFVFKFSWKILAVFSTQMRYYEHVYNIYIMTLATDAYNTKVKHKTC